MEVESLAPTHVNWGLDNRLAMLRYPAQRGAASRVEMRVGDGSAAIHNAVASLLFAGLDGLERGLELPPACAQLPYEDDETLGEPLPSRSARRSTRWPRTSTSATAWAAG